MSLAEVKERVKGMTSEELEDLAHHVEFIRRVNDPAWQAEMERRISVIDAGAKMYSAEEVRAEHERLIAEGR